MWNFFCFCYKGSVLVLHHFFPPKLCVYCSNLLCCSILLQSRVGPVEWLKPYTDETIVELGQKGVKSLLAVPIRYG